MPLDTIKFQHIWQEQAFYNMLSNWVQIENTCQKATWTHGSHAPEYRRCSLVTPRSHFFGLVHVCIALLIYLLVLEASQTSSFFCRAFFSIVETPVGLFAIGGGSLTQTHPTPRSRLQRGKWDAQIDWTIRRNFLGDRIRGCSGGTESISYSFNSPHHFNLAWYQHVCWW